MSRVMNVLFLCTGNSARSILAEAVLNQQGAGRFHAYSAGSHPAGHVNPVVLKLLEKNRYGTSQLRSKNWDEFALADAPVMDFVLTVCDKAAGETCPLWPGQPMSAHWGVADPVSAHDGDDKPFVDALMVLTRRISLFTVLPFEKLSRMALQQEMTAIGKVSAN